MIFGISCSEVPQKIYFLQYFDSTKAKLFSFLDAVRFKFLLALNILETFVGSWLEHCYWFGFYATSVYGKVSNGLEKLFTLQHYFPMYF